MTLTIDLSAAVARALEEKARETGLSLAEFAAAVLANAAGNRPEGSPERRADLGARLAALERVGTYDSRVRAGLPPLSDADISRDSIYQGRGQ